MDEVSEERQLIGYQNMTALARLVWERPYDPKLAARLYRIQCPTLLIWGNKDRAVYPSSADTLRRCFKDCALSIIEGAGHLPYEETPEEFNRIVIDFLTATS